MKLSPSTLLITLSLVVGAPALATDINGMLSGHFVSFDRGIATTHMSLQLSCALSCPVQAPDLHFGVTGGVSAAFAQAPTESAGVISASFGTDDMGHNEKDTTAFPPGTAVVLTAKSATCWCSNRNGEGGYIDITSTAIAVPPFIATDTAEHRAGDQLTLIIDAQPRGSETISVKASGAGIDQTVTLTTADFGTQSSAFARFTPTAAGALHLTATFSPYTVFSTADVTVLDASATGTGGGAGGGGGTDTQPMGCTAAPGGLIFSALALLLRRRALPRSS